MPLDRSALLVAAFIVALSAPTVAQQPKDVDQLGCWQTERREVPRQGTFHAAFCFLKGGRISGADLHGTSGRSLEGRWRRLGRAHVEIGGQNCGFKRSRDGTMMLLSGCPKYARQWFRAEPRHVLLGAR